MAHAKLSPSAAERWMTCPGSVKLSEGVENKSSAYADEGTLAHSIAELILRGQAHSATPEMVANVKVYTDYVYDLCHSWGDAEWFLEKQVKVSNDLWGTADAIVWRPEGHHLHVVDLKYGAGVAVEVGGNLQLKIYALAALLTMGFPATRVTTTIVQPRCPHRDGPIRSETFSVVDLIDFQADLDKAVQDVHFTFTKNDLEPFLVPSEKGCRWCPASFKCPKLRQIAQERAKQVFAPGQDYDPASLAETLDYLPILEGWIKNVREFAYREAEQGRTTPGYKLVQKVGRRKWIDEIEAAATLSAIIDQDDLYSKPELISPAAAEKLLAKTDRDVLAELTIVESSGHTLVHETDKRPAIKKDAKTVFSKVQDGEYDG